ncbi:unnamed protein product [Ilex paraguariensis]|uniref:ZF-HD dimerization-type domain-containing protein n=1 Tax=Ilex paraguariensis TaxID=185542 RepID=A0ABC8UDH5_9AQUA
MSMTGENGEIRMSCSLDYSSLETLDHGRHLPQRDYQQEPPSSNPERFSDAGIIKSATNAPISGGSKPKTPSTPPSRYRQCLKNHAASMGGNVTDGCGEFMPSGDEGTVEALKCAACNCHRNFHRKLGNCDTVLVHPLPLPPPLTRSTIPTLTHSNHWNSSIVQPVKIAFGDGTVSVATDSSSDGQELNFNAFQSNSALPQPPPQPPFGLAKKRSRTKFTRDQKDKMMEFAEKVGWRIPKESDAEAQRFCAEIGVKRQVLKVWMHNNKNHGKKQPQEP